MKWNRLGGEIVFDARVFRVRRDRYEFEGKKTHPFFVLETRPWTNVVALTPGREVVLVSQFRHGIEDTSLEVPGGMVDEGEEPAAAAARELLEETGYAGRPPLPLTTVSSNPAILTNRTHCFLIEDARPTSEPSPDPHEDLEVQLCSVDRLAELLETGVIHHALSACAIGAFLRRLHT